MYLFKQLNRQGESWRVDSADVCKNLISSTTGFISGQSFGGTCYVYSEEGCEGTRKPVPVAGDNFGFEARSMKCPCE